MSTLISFRLTDNEVELLKREQLDDESLNLVAARLVREKLGLSLVNTQLTDSKQSLTDLITDIVSEKLETIQQLQKEANQENRKLTQQALIGLENRLINRIEVLEKSFENIQNTQEVKAQVNPSSKRGRPKKVQGGS